MMVSKAFSYYVFSFNFSMCDTFTFGELWHDTFTLFTEEFYFHCYKTPGKFLFCD
jgi:hypothetical protein